MSGPTGSRAVGVSRVSLGLDLLDAKLDSGAKSVRLASGGLRQKTPETDGGLLQELTVEAVLRAAHAQAPESVLAAQLPSRGYTAIAQGLSSLVNLRTLDLACNIVASLLPLAGLPSLRVLNLQGNCLRALPPAGAGAAAGFQALEELDLSFNTLEPQALSFLQALPRLRQLDISGNGLASLGPLLSLTGFSALRSLKAASNRLGAEALGQLQWLPMLQQLDLSRNEIASVALLGDPLLAFPQLQVMDLSHNCLPADTELLHSLASHPRLILLGNAGSRRSQRGAGASPRKPSLVQSSLMFSIEEAPAPSYMASRAKAAAAAAPALRGGSGSGASGAGSCEQPASEGPAAQRAAQEGSGSSQAGPGEGGWQEGHIPAEFLADSALGSMWSVAEDSGQVLGEISLAGGKSSRAAGNEAAVQQAGSDSGGEGSEEAEEEGEGETGVALHWTDSWGQSDSTEDSEGDALWGVEDPTIRLALALGLDPLHLSWFQPPASEGSSKFPCVSAAVNALKFALAHPPTAAGNHLKGTKSTEAKRRPKFQGLLAAAGDGGAGAAAAPPEVQAGRLAAVDALLAAMKKRLRKVQAQIWGEISATFELCAEEGPLAGHNTSAAPTPLPGATSPVAERSQQRSATATPSRLSACSSHSRLSFAGQAPAAAISPSPSRLSVAGQTAIGAISPSPSWLSMAGHTPAVTPPPPFT